jgi:hypothetical protein
MTLPDAYKSILGSRGHQLSVINPGSSEVALDRPSALEAIEALSGSAVAILGGDVLTEDGGSLRYVYATWSTSRKGDESMAEFASRSHAEAAEYVRGYESRSGVTPLFVLVTNS